MAKSIKLSKEMKERILSKALCETFENRNALALKKEHALAERIYGEVVGPYLGTMDKLPESFFCSRTAIRIKIKGSNHYGIYLDLSQAKRQPAFAENSLLAEYEQTHKYSKLLSNMNILKEGIKKDRKELSSSLWSLLSGINTTKQLQELWPEGEKYLPAQNDTTDNLPAVNVDSVRDMMERFST